MINIAKEKNPMPEQEPMIRNKNFLEVCEGYTEEMAIREAMRCLRCRKKPCMMVGCPVHNHIPDFIAKVAEGDFEAAYQVLAETTSLPAVCGRVCPQEKQCEGSCVRGIKGQPVGIGNLERFVADWHRAHVEEAVQAAESNGHKVAVIGAGPAGIACAGDLIDKGYDVTVYEKMEVAGGVMAYGIPEFRLPNAVVEAEISKLEAKGVKFVTGKAVGSDVTIDDLMDKEGFESVFVGNGAGVPTTMGIPGEDLDGVCVASDYLVRINLDKAYDAASSNPLPKAKKIAIVGGGNVAMDAARSAIRTGADKVYIVYRRTEQEMPAHAGEIKEAKDEGIEFLFLTNPVAVKAGADGKVAGMECIKMELGEPDESGRRRPVEVKGSNFVLDVDYVIMAIGTKFDPSVAGNVKDLETTAKGGSITDDATAATSRAGVFAGGDAVTGPETVILAMGAGKKAAAAIDAYLTK